MVHDTSVMKLLTNLMCSKFYLIDQHPPPIITVTLIRSIQGYHKGTVIVQNPLTEKMHNNITHIYVWKCLKLHISTLVVSGCFTYLLSCRMYFLGHLKTSQCWFCISNVMSSVTAVSRYCCSITPINSCLKQTLQILLCKTHQETFDLWLRYAGGMVNDI